MGSEDFEGMKADVEIDAVTVVTGGEVVGIQGLVPRSRWRRL